MRARSGCVAGLAGLALVAGLAWSSPPAHAQGTLSALQTDVDLIARRARASVVAVVAQAPLPSRAASSGRAVRPHVRVGSGVAVEENAILTTASVVQGAQRVYVRTSNGIEVEARVAGIDVILNIAYLRVPELRLPPMALATDRGPQAGDWAVALGTSYRREPTQSVGTVVDRHVEPGLTRFQLTNTVYPGNSGGPVLNARGELVGLVLGELGSMSGSEFERRPGANSLMLPLEHVRAAWDDLRRLGRVRHGWFGIGSRGAFVESSTQKGLRVPIGALVESVAPGGPAERAGLRAGDLVVAFEGARVEYPEQLGRWVTATRPAAVVEVVWVRNEVRQSARVTLAESPVAQPEWAVADSAPSVTAGAAPGQRITELEREIERLRAEVARLRGQPSGSVR